MKRRMFMFFVVLSSGLIGAKACSLPDSLSNPLRVPERQATNLKLQSDLKDKEATISLLTQHQQRQKVQNERLQSETTLKSILLYTMLAGSSVMLFLIVALTRSRRRTWQANQQLAAKNEEIRQKNLDLLKRNEETRLQHEAINAQRKALEEMNQVKDKMFSVIAHDFRSPLNTIQGVLNLLHMDVLSSEELDSMLPHLIRKVDYSINLLDNLLNWARTQMNGLRVKTITFTLGPEIEQTIGMMSQLARQKNIRIEKDILKDCIVHADPDMIQMVVRNLLSNAIKFTQAGGLIRITTEEKENAVVVAISDTGVGMEETVLQKLFKQTGYSTQGTAQEKGTGLGLKLCSEFIRRNGGSIWGESKKNEGTTLYFTVPMEEVIEEASDQVWTVVSSENSEAK